MYTYMYKKFMTVSDIRIKNTLYLKNPVIRTWKFLIDYLVTHKKAFKMAGEWHMANNLKFSLMYSFWRMQ